MAESRDFSKLLPLPPRETGDDGWRPRTIDEETKLHWLAYAPFYLVAVCEACGHRGRLDMNAIIATRGCGQMSMAWLKQKLACTNERCRAVGKVELVREEKPPHIPDPNRALGGHGVVHGPLPADIEERRLKDYRRRHGSRRKWHLKN